MRVGFGYDVHAFANGRSLILGGVHVSYEKGLSGHSDADVLVHAVIDALLGAAALGDIGFLFPDSDAQYKDISSVYLLKKVVDILLEKGYICNNVDCTVVAQAPKLAQYREEIRNNLAAALGIAKEYVSVKATTTEGLGFTGKKEGIAAYAVCSIDDIK